MSKVSHKTGGGAATKIHTTSKLGHVVSLNHVVSTDASDWNRFKNIKEETENMVETKGVLTHRIGLTVSDPNHPMVSKRGETYQKSVRVSGPNRKAAISQAIAHHRRKGYKVFDHHYFGTVAEETLSELKKSTLGSYAKKAKGEMGLSAMAAGAQSARGNAVGRAIDIAHAKKRSKGLDKAITRLTKEETVLETKGAPKGFHFTKDGKLKRGDADQDGNGGPMLRTDPLDKQRNKVPAVSERADHTFKSFRNQIAEKHLSTAEMKKREEVAQAMEREQPGMQMGKKMAIATATAKKAA